MRHCRDLLAGREVDGPEADPHDLVEALTDAIAYFNDLAEEVVNLKQALVSRATIDQAKGILMATHGCTADDAFQMLRQLSNDTNVRLADLAAALVLETRKPA